MTNDDTQTFHEFEDPIPQPTHDEIFRLIKKVESDIMRRLNAMQTTLTETAVRQRELETTHTMMLDHVQALNDKVIVHESRLGIAETAVGEIHKLHSAMHNGFAVLAQLIQART